MNAGEMAAYEMAMTENTLLKAVLDGLKAEGCAPATASRRRCAGLGERLRAETGLPLTRILAFLGISKSPASTAGRGWGPIGTPGCARSWSRPSRRCAGAATARCTPNWRAAA